MNIQLNENYRITSDKDNVILEERKISKKGKNEGKEYYKQIGYFPNLEVALKDFARLKIKLSDTEGIEELKDLMKEILEEIRRVAK